jgi:hypothetical protein
LERGTSEQTLDDDISVVGDDCSENDADTSYKLFLRDDPSGLIFPF